MSTFRIGDKVRRLYMDGARGSLRRGETYIVSRVNPTGTHISLVGIIGAFAAKNFDKIRDTTPEKALPLTHVLRMDREIAKAGGAPGILEEYLDRPLSDFVQNVMVPNKLNLKFG